MTDTMEVKVEDILRFLNKSTRDKNDETNKIRERLLLLLSNIPKEYLEHPEFGERWRNVHNAWIEALKLVAEKGGVGIYTSTQINLKGGRGSNFDFEAMYYNDTTLLTTGKIEFKYGVDKINDLPQFASPSVRTAPFLEEKYDAFYYLNYLPKYLALDPGITEPLPSIDDYLKSTNCTNYSVTPFIAQLRSRELIAQTAKVRLVNASIEDYLTKYGSSINLDSFAQIVREKQLDKSYLLWSKGKFHYDSISESQITNMTFKQIRNGNTIELMSGSTRYDLRLRWRNHHGILMPAWQVKRGEGEVKKRQAKPKEPKAPKKAKEPKAPKEPKKRQARPKKPVAV